MSGAIPRTVQPAAPMGVAPRGGIAAPLPLHFPNANAGEVLDYAVDFSEELQGGSDLTLIDPMVSVQPSGQLAASNVGVEGQVVSFNLGGGVANTAYVVCVSAQSSSSALTVQSYVNIFILPVPQPEIVLTAGACFPSDQI